MGISNQPREYNNDNPVCEKSSMAENTTENCLKRHQEDMVTMDLELVFAH